jgi:hypothetical protein
VKAFGLPNEWMADDLALILMADGACVSEWTVSGPFK